MSDRIARSIIIDDQQAMITDIQRNLKPALQRAGVELQVIERYTDHSAAIDYLVGHPGSVDLIVTDVLWPRPPGSVPKQHEEGLQVIQYAKEECPNALIVALSLGDEAHRTVRRRAGEAGAHIVRLHQEDLPGDDGKGWLELGRTIADFLRAGQPFGRSWSPLGQAHPERTAIDEARALCDSFRRLPEIAKPLVQRRKRREPFAIRDEADVQDIVEVLLWCRFEDVRAEERAPSSAGSASVLDFLVPEISLGVEVKVARAGHRHREVRDELLIDLNDYATHPDVRAVVAVVADLASVIRNPRGFEGDLSGVKNGLPVEVVVVDLAALTASLTQDNVG